MATNLETIIDKLKSGITSLALGTGKQYITEATTDGNNIINSLKSEIPEWIIEITKGDMNAEDLKFLLLEREETFKMIALKQVGLAQIDADNFKSGLINLIVITLTTVV